MTNKEMEYKIKTLEAEMNCVTDLVEAIFEYLADTCLMGHSDVLLKLGDSIEEIVERLSKEIENINEEV